MILTAPFHQLTPKPFETTWRSPSNIAFVKYWGKKGHQLPANPSVSMTLKECYTETSVSFAPAENLMVELFLDGKREEKFAAKIKKYLETLSDLPWINQVSFTITTSNTFPHGTGIASSASGLSAFALCLTEYCSVLTGQSLEDEMFFKRASFFSRLASGSACRSLYGGFATWGEFDSSSSDLYATPFEVHPELSQLRDSVLVISGDEKIVSSTAGHGRMNEHPFAEARFIQARKNFELMTAVLKNGDLEEMGRILESEALTLHSLMMTSPTPYTLLKPNTLAVIDRLWAFRRETKIPLFFTLDAGPNLHLIYPDTYQNKVKTFISHELAPLTELIIEDEMGDGPQKR